MIIQCPACATKYVVPDAAIGVDGRTVRCAKCRHSWFQDGPPIDVPEDKASEVPPPSSTPTTPPPSSTPTTPPTPPRETRSSEPTADVDAQPITPKPAPAPAPAPRYDVPLPPTSTAYGDDVPSHFDHEPPFRPRRNPLKMWTWAAGIFAAIAAALMFAVSYWGLPDWVPVDQPTFAAGNPDLQLDFPPEQRERRTLPNGTEYFGASGTITNIGTSTHDIPTLLIVMRDSRDRIVWSWEVAPPQRTLAPGETVVVTEAVTDIPRTAKMVQIGWKPS